MDVTEIRRTTLALGLVDNTGRVMDAKALHAWAYGAGVAAYGLDAAWNWPQTTTHRAVQFNSWSPLTGHTGVNAPPQPLAGAHGSGSTPYYDDGYSPPVVRPRFARIPTPRPRVLRYGLANDGLIDAANNVPAEAMNRLYYYALDHDLIGADFDGVVTWPDGVTIDEWAEQRRFNSLDGMREVRLRLPHLYPPAREVVRPADVYGPDDDKPPPVYRKVVFLDWFARGGWRLPGNELEMWHSAKNGHVDATLAEIEEWTGAAPGSIERAAADRGLIWGPLVGESVSPAGGGGPAPVK